MGLALYLLRMGRLRRSTAGGNFQYWIIMALCCTWWKWALAHSSCHNISRLSQGLDCSNNGALPFTFPFPYSKLVRCNVEKMRLELRSVRGAFQVQSIDYDSKTMSIEDPSMSTCSSLKPIENHHFSPDSIMPASQHNTLVLFNCTHANSISSLCEHTNSSISCRELYDECPAFESSKLSNSSSMDMSCCITDYQRLGNYSLTDLECSHYMSIYDSGGERKKSPEVWCYGIKLSMNEGEGDVPDIGEFCEKCDPDHHSIFQDHRRCGIGRECICYPHKCEDGFLSKAAGKALAEKFIKTSLLLAGASLWIVFS